MHHGKQAVPGTTANTIVVVQRRHDHPFTLEAADQSAKAGGWCFEANDVELLDSYMPSSGLRQICVYAALDAESVRKANRVLKLPFERVWSAATTTA